MTNSDSDKNDIFQITAFGYISAKNNLDSVTGGMLVIDGYGDPSEFIVTDPVSIKWPTRVLFGDRLMGYLESSVLAPTLIKSLKSKPVLLCFDDPSILLRKVEVGIPVAVSAPDTAPFNERYWTKLENMEPTKDQNAWWAQFGAADQIHMLLDEIGRILAPAQRHEPFARLQEALKDSRQIAAAK